MTVESLKPMTDAELLEKVKTAINLKGNDYQNDTIQFWIDNVKMELLHAGVSAEVVCSTLAAGCIARGVDDKWASHRDAYSDMFYTSADALRDIKVEGAV